MQDAVTAIKPVAATLRQISAIAAAIGAGTKPARPWKT
jgi:hypothetical protein